jgi:hypothetical protein
VGWLARITDGMARDAFKERGSFMTSETGHMAAEELLRMPDDGSRY